ncbi:MAG: TIGR02646 family protein [Candidatus Delongbacteria bacterium]|nr:TIGR02646 family protein [Candidatus Delongbacteria bacterium]
MKYIHKGNEPPEIIDWKNTDKMCQNGNPRWNRLPTELKDLLRKRILEEQGYICCYCERNIGLNDFHLEHIKPKGINKYKIYQLDYNNLLCSCQLELEQGEPRHCGNSKGSWYVEDQFISPLDEDCEERFIFTVDGSIYPANEQDIIARKTIEKLQLDIDKLRNLRKNAIEPFLDENITEEELELFVQGYLVDKRLNNDVFNEFYTTIKYLFGN